MISADQAKNKARTLILLGRRRNERERERGMNETEIYYYMTCSLHFMYWLTKHAGKAFFFLVFYLPQLNLRVKVGGERWTRCIIFFCQVLQYEDDSRLLFICGDDEDSIMICRYVSTFHVSKFG